MRTSTSSAARRLTAWTSGASQPTDRAPGGWPIRNGLPAAGTTPRAADRTAIAEDRIPPSLMSDTLHLNAAGYTAIGVRLAAVITLKGWFTL